MKKKKERAKEVEGQNSEIIDLEKEKEFCKEIQNQNQKVLMENSLNNNINVNTNNKENENIENKNETKVSLYNGWGDNEIIDLCNDENLEQNNQTEKENDYKFRQKMNNSIINIFEDDRSLFNKKKINFVFDDRNKDGIVKFEGAKKSNFNNQNPDILRHYIYLRTQNDFNSEAEKTEFKWTVKILNNTQFIGVGLADKNVVINNNHQFFSTDQTFYNGVFCLYSIFMHDRNKNQILPWHPNNRLLNNYVVNFPPFVFGQEITMVYNTYYKSLIFTTKFKYKKKEWNYRMKNVIPLDKVERTLTPCIIFYFPGDQIQISNLEVIKISNDLFHKINIIIFSIFEFIFYIKKYIFVHKNSNFNLLKYFYL